MGELLQLKLWLELSTSEALFYLTFNAQVLKLKELCRDRSAYFKALQLAA